MNPIQKHLLLLFLFTGLLSAGCTKAQPDITSESSPQSKVEQLEWSKDANIYEVNIRQYSEEGTINKVTEDLDRLHEMGVEILWLMPIHPIGEVNRKGPLGSYYAVKDYKKFSEDYGTEQDLRVFVNEAHERGMKVIIDWVANHTAWDNPWTENPEWYELTENGDFMPPRGTDWTDVIQLDFSNEEMRVAMWDAMEYWVREFDIDGYRCDVAGKVPTDFWVNTIDSLNEIKPVFMLAEDGEPELVIEAFHMNYAWQYAHVIREIAKGEQSLADLVALMDETEKNYPSTAYRMYFTTNHDENSWNGTDPGMYGENFENFAVLSATISGMPLIYNGQESGLDKQLEFFEKDPIEWKDYKYQEFYTNLLQLKKDHQALWNGAFGGTPEFLTAEDGLLVYKRNKGDSEVIVGINFSGNAADIAFSEYAGGNADDYEIHTGTSADIQSLEQVTLEPHTWVILASK